MKKLSIIILLLALGFGFQAEAQNCNQGDRLARDTWAEWGKGTFTEAVLDVFVFDVRQDPKTRGPQVLADATKRLTKNRKLNKPARQQPNLTGNEPTTRQ